MPRNDEPMVMQDARAASRPNPALRRPRLPAGGEPAPAAVLAALRTFHRRGRAVDGADLRAPGDDILPALLFRFPGPDAVRHDYPLVLVPESDASDRLCPPLHEVLAALVESIAPGSGDARILKDNLRRLERAINAALHTVDAAAGGPAGGPADAPADGPEDGPADGPAGGPVEASTCLAGAGRAMVKELDLRSAAAAELEADLAKLWAAVPPGALLLAHGSASSLHLLAFAARRRARARGSRQREQVSDLRSALADLLRVDDTKGPHGRRQDVLGQSVGSAGADHLDPAKLARLVGHARGPAAMSATRRQHVEEALQTLDVAIADTTTPAVSVVASIPAPPSLRDADVDWHVTEPDGICAGAAALFDDRARAAARLFGAMRVARLLRAGTYDDERHGSLLAAFDWESFTAEELGSLPPVVAVETASHLAGAGMQDLSRLLLSGRPVEVLVEVHPAQAPGAEADEHDAGRRFELAYLGISHRETVVNQSSSARPRHLVDGFLTALDASTSSLHVVTSGLTAGGGVPRLGAWMHAGAALEGRAHPFLHYNPEAGATWARRIDVAENPQPESAWPRYELEHLDAAGETRTQTVAFTFADFALLEPRFRDEYRLLPASVDAAEIVPIEEHLAAPPALGDERLPFVWAADGDGVLHRLVVSRRLVALSRDRLDFWRTLQELAGIGNEHVREALERQREELESAFGRERERLVADQEARIDAARRDAARDAMERLARALVDPDAVVAALPSVMGRTPSAEPAAKTGPVDATAPAAEAGPVGSAAPAAPAAAAAEDAAAVEAPAAAAEEPPDTEDPWVDSALCTSCNDCIDLNPRLFVYNSNKQAVIGDPAAGTYAQLVKAAEKCPARCIHPGTPLDPQEPKLDELRERAKPFR